MVAMATEGRDAATVAHGRHAVLTAMVSNMGVALGKLVGFLLTGSVALLAESLHSVADTGNQVLLLLGAHRARRGSSPRHPFGRGREQYFWAFVVGLVLFGMGGVVSITEGVRKLSAGDHGVDRPGVALVLIGFGALLEGWSLRVGYRAARATLPTDVGLWRGLRRSRNPEVTIVVFEDTGALLGLALAAAGIVATMVTGNAVFDAAATVAIGLLLCGIASVLAVEMHALLIGEPASRPDHDRIERAIAETAGVGQILNLRTEHIGPDDLLVCMKLELDETLDLDGAIDTIDRVEAAVHAAVPATLVCYVEPDRYDAARQEVPWT